MDRRLPRSPALKSPVLSPKSPAIYESYKSGCAWGLIHFFDFRQGHSHGKLIADKKRGNNRRPKDNSYTRSRLSSVSNEERHQYPDDADQNRVGSRKPEGKKVIKEEMSVRHQPKKTVNAETQNLQFNSKLVGHSKDHPKASKNSKKPCRSAAPGFGNAATEGYRQPSDQNMVDKSSNRNNLASLTEASGSNVHTNNGGNNHKRIRGRKHKHQTEINLQVNMNEAIEAFVNQKLADGESLSIKEVANRSKDFIDALEILNANKELFMKLLQDPNSLLVKHIQGLRDSQAKNQQPQSSSETKTSQCQPKEAGECEPANAIVVLKPGIQNCRDRISNWPSPQSHYSLKKKETSVRPPFLSLEHMKRKLRHAMRVNKKEQCQMLPDGNHKSQHDFRQFEDGAKEMSRKANERISAGKGYLDVEKMSESSNEVNRKDGMVQKEKFDSELGGQAASSVESCHRSLNPLTVRQLKGKFHPRKHLSEILNRGSEDISRRQTLRILDRITSLPEQDLLPTLTPGRDKGHELASPQMRFSPYSNPSTVHGYKWRVQRETESDCLSSSLTKTFGAQSVSDKEKPADQLQGAKESASGDLSPPTKVLQTVYSLSDDLSHKVDQTSLCPGGVTEGDIAVRWGESNALEPNVVQITKANGRAETVDKFGEREYVECPSLDLPLEDQNQTSVSIHVHSSSPSHIQRDKDFDQMIEGAEQPSPVSVLEQFFVEDNTSSPSTVSLAAEQSVESFCIDIEDSYTSSLMESHLDQKKDVGTSMHEQGSFSEYIRSVLQISGLNWDQLCEKWHLSEQMLDSSLFDNVEVWPDKSTADRRLLFGYINEVLLEIYQSYFRCSSWVSVLNPRPRPALLSKNMAHEVLRHVDWLLLSELPQQTLQQLVEKDLGKSGTWMDTRLDTEEVVFELVDSILEDLVVDTAIGCILEAEAIHAASFASFQIASVK